MQNTEYIYILGQMLEKMNEFILRVTIPRIDQVNDQTNKPPKSAPKNIYL